MKALGLILLAVSVCSFEAYFAASRKSKGTGRRANFDTMEDGTYADDHTQRHWWTWQNARAALPQQAQEAPALEELRRAICGIRIVGYMNDYEVIRRNSVLDLIDQRRAAIAKGEQP